MYMCIKKDYGQMSPIPCGCQGVHDGLCMVIIHSWSTKLLSEEFTLEILQTIVPDRTADGVNGGSLIPKYQVNIENIQYILMLYHLEDKKEGAVYIKIAVQIYYHLFLLKKVYIYLEKI